MRPDLPTVLWNSLPVPQRDPVDSGPKYLVVCYGIDRTRFYDKYGDGPVSYETRDRGAFSHKGYLVYGWFRRPWWLRHYQLQAAAAVKSGVTSPSNMRSELECASAGLRVVKNRTMRQFSKKWPDKMDQHATVRDHQECRDNIWRHITSEQFRLK